MSSRLAIGTVQFGLSYGIANQGGQVGSFHVADILNLAKNNGINTLDTAIAYGDSEACLGEYGVADWHVVTKLQLLPEDCLDVFGWVFNQIHGSLSRLKIPRLYGLLLHHPNQLFGPLGLELIAALKAVQKIGLVRRIGVSVYAPKELESICTIFLPDIVQAPLSLIDRRIATSGWLDRLANSGVEIHTRSTFLQGLLLMEEVPNHFGSWSNLFATWQEWKKRNVDHDLTACLSYPLSFPQVSRVVVGVDNLLQLQQLVNVKNLFPVNHLPNLSCEDEKLINPSNWINP